MPSKCVKLQTGRVSHAQRRGGGGWDAESIPKQRGEARGRQAPRRKSSVLGEETDPRLSHNFCSLRCPLIAAKKAGGGVFMTHAIIFGQSPLHPHGSSNRRGGCRFSPAPELVPVAESACLSGRGSGQAGAAAEGSGWAAGCCFGPSAPGLSTQTGRFLLCRAVPL